MGPWLKVSYDGLEDMGSNPQLLVYKAYGLSPIQQWLLPYSYIQSSVVDEDKDLNLDS